MNKSKKIEAKKKKIAIENSAQAKYLIEKQHEKEIKMQQRRNIMQIDFENKMEALEEAQRQKMDHIENNKILKH